MSIAAAAIGAAGSLLGGAMNKKATKQASDQNVALQREFAQNGIRWKVEDAKAAGLHPLAALGATGASFSPSVQVGSMGDAVSDMGQDISRAVYANQSKAERMEEAARLQAYNDAQLRLQTEQVALQNGLMRKQIDLVDQQLITNKLEALKSFDSIGLPSHQFRGPLGVKSRSEIEGQGDSVFPKSFVSDPSHVPITRLGDSSSTGGNQPAFNMVDIGGGSVIPILRSDIVEDQPIPITYGIYFNRFLDDLKRKYWDRKMIHPSSRDVQKWR